MRVLLKVLCAGTPTPLPSTLAAKKAGQSFGRENEAVYPPTPADGVHEFA